MEIQAHKEYGKWLEALDKGSFTMMMSINHNYGEASKEYQLIDVINRIVTEIKRVMVASACEEHPSEMRIFTDLYGVDSSFEKWKFSLIDVIEKNK